jgi:hypothetical protein
LARKWQEPAASFKPEIEQEMEDIAIGLRQVVAQSAVAMDAEVLSQFLDAIYLFPNNMLSNHCD